MPRFCNQCGGQLNDKDHDRGEAIPTENPVTGRVAKRRPWLCRVRKIGYTFGTNLDTGERKVTTTYVPDSMQRTRQNMAAFVPVRILEARKQAA